MEGAPLIFNGIRSGKPGGSLACDAPVAPGHWPSATGAWVGSRRRADLATLVIPVLEAGSGATGVYLTRSPLDLAQKAFQLYQLLPQVGGSVRTVTIRAIKLEPHGQPEQLDLYSDFRRREKQETLNDTVNDL